MLTVGIINTKFQQSLRMRSIRINRDSVSLSIAFVSLIENLGSRYVELKLMFRLVRHVIWGSAKCCLPKALLKLFQNTRFINVYVHVVRSFVKQISRDWPTKIYSTIKITRKRVNVKRLHRLSLPLPHISFFFSLTALNFFFCLASQ